MLFLLVPYDYALGMSIKSKYHENLYVKMNSDCIVFFSDSEDFQICVSDEHFFTISEEARVCCGVFIFLKKNLLFHSFIYNRDTTNTHTIWIIDVRTLFSGRSTAILLCFFIL